MLDSQKVAEFLKYKLIAQKFLTASRDSENTVSTKHCLKLTTLSKTT